jgi:predicted  nucleic acid-binding Zn-ribbon protein
LEEQRLITQAVIKGRAELQSLESQTDKLRNELAGLEESFQKKTADFNALEQLFTEETQKIREELARKESSLDMESSLLREQRNRMDVRERALNAQRREL